MGEEITEEVTDKLWLLNSFKLESLNRLGANLQFL